ncbi:hypothetical protein WLQ65_16990 [Pseudoalteromonas piscicida]|uniref:hypothetical protein n=1 Tax=Pseudoalteromonas piscicida TaxID=43662 RepID=UPI0030C8FB5E
MEKQNSYLTNLNDCKNFNELWKSLHYQLEPFKISSVFYGVLYSQRSIQEIGILKSIIYKTTHPKEYRSYLHHALFSKEANSEQLRQLLDEDASAKKVLLSDKEYFLWADPTEWHSSTSVEREIDKKLNSMNLTTGVTIPVRNAEFLSGVGLGAGNTSAKAFQKIWESSSEEILLLVNKFNKLVQGQHLVGFVNLTPHQLNVFKDYFYNDDLHVLAKKYNCTQRNIQLILQGVRKKLNAQNNNQAVVKAFVLGII